MQDQIAQNEGVTQPVQETPIQPVSTPPEAAELNEKSSKLPLLLLLLFGVVVIGGIAVYVVMQKGKDDDKADEFTNVVTNGVELGPAEDEDQTDDTTDADDVDPYEGWKACEHENLNLTVRHPSNWHCEQDTLLRQGDYDMVLSMDGKRIEFTDTYSFSPAEDSGCISDLIEITTVLFGGKDYEVSYCEESTFPKIFNQITYDFDTTPPGMFYIVGTGYTDPEQSELDTLELIFDSLELINS